MFATGHPASHEEAWLALPWLANGRISQAERDKIEPHVHTCGECREELAFQRLLCDALGEPDRVTYAPGPSFRKLMERIDSAAPQARKSRGVTSSSVTSDRPRKSGSTPQRVSLWRPPGLAWAASFVLLIGIAGVVTGAYRSSQPIYATHTDPTHTDPNVLHIAFDRSVTVGEADEALRSAGAHIVEGPDGTGIIGVSLDTGNSGKPASERVDERLRLLSARLRADPRVRWVEPVPGDSSSGGAQASTFRGP